MNQPFVTANGQQIAASLPCCVEEFLIAQGLSPRSVVVEHNGEAVAPSEFFTRQLHAGDRLEIVKIVAGGGRRQTSLGPRFPPPPRRKKFNLSFPPLSFACAGSPSGRFRPGNRKGH